MTDVARIAAIERANYAALVPIAAVTPGLELMLRDDVILTSSTVFPAPDTTHACMLQTSPTQADALIDQIVDYFATRQLPTTIYLSPVCEPSDLAQRLLGRGFVANEHAESWMVLEQLERIHLHSNRVDVTVQPVTKDEAESFARTFLLAFEQPVEFASILAELLRPSIGLPTITHYLARVGDDLAGTISLTQHEQYGIIGSAGVLPHHRSSRIVVELFRAIYHEASQKHLTTLVAQTQIGSIAEQLLITNHFARAFVRHAYIYRGQA